MAFYRVRPLGTQKTWLGFTGLVLFALFLPMMLYLVVPERAPKNMPVVFGSTHSEWSIPIVDSSNAELQCPGEGSVIENTNTWMCPDDITLTASAIESGSDPKRTLHRAIRAYVPDAYPTEYDVHTIGNLRYVQVDYMVNQTVVVLTGTGEQEGNSFLITIVGSDETRQAAAKLIMANLVREDRKLTGDEVSFAEASQLVEDNYVAPAQDTQDGAPDGSEDAPGDIPGENIRPELPNLNPIPVNLEQEYIR